MPGLSRSGCSQELVLLLQRRQHGGDEVHIGVAHVQLLAAAAGGGPPLLLRLLLQLPVVRVHLGQQVRPARKKTQQSWKRSSNRIKSI
jgi:hypothetical protein